ncbi:MAG: glucokinase [Sandaracinus sp.]
MSDTLALVADVGGTHCRFALATHDETGAVELSAPHTYASASADGIEPLLLDHLSRCGARPGRISLAVAGPVEDGVCRTTNLPWRVDARAVRAALEARSLGAEVTLLNDFEAVAWGVREVPAGLRVTLQAGPRDPSGVIAVLGAGTGLGEALAVPLPGGGLRVIPTEGGHADFGPRDAVDDGLLAFLRARFPDHVSYERVLSGPGLTAIFEHLTDGTGVPVRGEVLGVEDPAREIVARHERCPHCRAAVERFVDLLGAEAGNLALKSLPSGGLFVAGGLAPRLRGVVAERLLPAVLAKGRMRPVLGRLPIELVLDGQVGLRGAAACVGITNRGALL